MRLEYINIFFTIIGALIGIKKGFLNQISSLLGLFIGLFITIFFSSYIKDFVLAHQILSPRVYSICSLFIIIVFSIIITKCILKTIEKILIFIGLGFTNKILGAILGAIKFFILSTIITTIIGLLLKIEKTYYINKLIEFI